VKVLVCGAHVPFVRGGAEALVETLVEALRARGHEAESVALPFNWTTRTAMLNSALAWRLLDLETLPIQRPDVVIATRFPSYAVRHPNKVVWLVHQMRQVYDLLGSRYSDFSTEGVDADVARLVRSADACGLGEARARFAISRNTADRLRRFNGLEAQVLHPPPRLLDRLRAAPPIRDAAGTVLAVGRLDELKRFDLAVSAVAESRRSWKLRLVGEGHEEESLRTLAARLGVAARVEFLGPIDDERLLACYEECFAVLYAPFDEDYGYVTVEAGAAARPVITAADSGGTLEFVTDGASGYVVAAGSGAAREMAARLDRLDADRAEARRLGAAGRSRVAGVGWDRVIPALLGTETE
jgi:glycosyltransferase involved in cell wall biosynthesis